MGVVVHSLFIHPLKSGKAVAVDAVDMMTRGPKGDRLWMVVDEAGKFLTQRQNAKLSQIDAQLDGAGGLFLKVSGMPDLHVGAEAARKLNQRREVEIWKDKCLAFDAGDEAAVWFERFLDTKCRLVGQLEEPIRPVKAEYGGQGEVVSFADDFPVLLATMPSLKALEPHFTSPITMNRFRPNIVTDGNGAFEEDVWHRIKIGEVEFDVTKPCPRCVVTTIDQATGEKPSKEPIETLVKFRRGKKGAYFGQNLLSRVLGTIRVGDKVEILKTGTSHAELEGVRLSFIM